MKNLNLLNLTGKETINKLLAGERMYFAEECHHDHKVWDEGRAEWLVELEKELTGLPVCIKTKEYYSNSVDESAGYYRGVQQIANGARSAGDPVCLNDLVHYWHDTFCTKGRIETFRSKVVLPGDLPNEMVTDLKSALPTYEFKYVGRSGFASRNSWVITGCPAEECEIIVLNVTIMSRTEAENVYLPTHPAADSDTNLIWFAVSASIGEQEVFDTSEAEAAYAHAINERRRQKQLELVGENPPAVLKVEIGGQTGFAEQHLPEGYTKLFEVVTAYMQDYRQGRTHQRAVWLADIQRIKRDGHRRIMLDIPSEHRGKFIGKGGKNIKELEAKIGLKINFA